MKVAEWKQLVRPLLPQNEDWGFRSWLCYRRPFDRMILGVLGEGSGFDKGIFIWRVMLPLYVPTKTISLSWSERMGGGARKYDSADEAGQALAVSQALDQLGTECDALRQLVARYDPESRNSRLHELVGYTNLLLGDVDAARVSLARAQSTTSEYPWVRELVHRAQLVSRILDDEGRDGAIRQLDEWCTQSIAAVGVDRAAPKPGSSKERLGS